MAGAANLLLIFPVFISCCGDSRPSPVAFWFALLGGGPLHDLWATFWGRSTKMDSVCRRMHCTCSYVLFFLSNLARAERAWTKVGNVGKSQRFDISAAALVRAGVFARACVFACIFLCFLRKCGHRQLEHINGIHQPGEYGLAVAVVGALLPLRWLYLRVSSVCAVSARATFVAISCPTQRTARPGQGGP